MIKLAFLVEVEVDQYQIDRINTVRRKLGIQEHEPQGYVENLLSDTLNDKMISTRSIALAKKVVPE